MKRFTNEPVAATLAFAGFLGWLAGGALYLAVRSDKGAVLSDLLLLALPYLVAGLLLMVRNPFTILAALAVLALPVYYSVSELGRTGWLSGFGGSIALAALIAAFALFELVELALRTGRRQPGATAAP